MTLDEFRVNKGLSYAALARSLGANHATIVRRWCIGDKVPSKRYMAVIIELTQGAVQPNDFYRNN